MPLHFEKDAGKKAALKEKMKEETVPDLVLDVGEVSSAAQTIHTVKSA